MIGNWGVRQVFKVSERQQHTFRDFKRDVGGRWASHDLIHRKPHPEYLGPKSDAVSYTVILSVYRGLQPRRMLESLERACAEGAAEYLYIGGRRVGSGKMYLESVSETWDEVWNGGELARCTVQLTFREYW